MQGGTGDDTLVGGSGDDTMYGESGNDTFFGDAGIDTMYGGAGSDRLWGGAGNDRYVFDGQGIDHINDGVTNTGTARTDATEDTEDVLYVSYSSNDLGVYRSGDDLIITSESELVADNTIDDAVVIDDFYQDGHYVVEYLVTADQQSYYLGGLLEA